MQLDTVTQHREVARFCVDAPEQSTKPAFRSCVHTEATPELQLLNVNKAI